MKKYTINGRQYTCSLQTALSAIMGKWKGIIIWILLFETKVIRYGELRMKIRAIEKVTDRMLIQALKELEGDGLIERRAYPTVPPKVEYKLTKSGLRLKPIIVALEKFGEAYSEK